MKLPGAPIDACTPAAVPSEQQGEGYRITGMYCPPSEASLLKTKNENAKGAKARTKTKNFGPTLEGMRSISDWQSDSPNEQHLNGHLVVGDLNPTGWADD